MAKGNPISEIVKDNLKANPIWVRVTVGWIILLDRVIEETLKRK